MEGLFPHSNRATERVLERNQCDVVDVEDQQCCGALHSHAGYVETAKKLARANIDAFLESGCDRVVVNAAGCGAAMKEYSQLLADDPEYAERAARFSSLVRDVSEFLVEIGMSEPTGRVEKRVAYDAPCHLLHAQRVAEAPLDLLKSIAGVDLQPLRGYDSCCGGAGVYNIQQEWLSERILAEKLENIRESGAQVVATGNPGCIMQIKAGLILRGMDVDVVHPVELLDLAYNDTATDGRGNE
jgi:glycolate oxidase iron-sulfur subunit